MSTYRRQLRRVPRPARAPPPPGRATPRREPVFRRLYPSPRPRGSIRPIAAPVPRLLPSCRARPARPPEVGTSAAPWNQAALSEQSLQQPSELTRGVPGKPALHQAEDSVDRRQTAVAFLEEHGEPGRIVDRELDRDRLSPTMAAEKWPTHGGLPLRAVYGNQARHEAADGVLCSYWQGNLRALCSRNVIYQPVRLPRRRRLFGVRLGRRC